MRRGAVLAAMLRPGGCAKHTVAEKQPSASLLPAARKTASPARAGGEASRLRPPARVPRRPGTAGGGAGRRGGRRGGTVGIQHGLGGRDCRAATALLSLKGWICPHSWSLIRCLKTVARTPPPCSRRGALPLSDRSTHPAPACSTPPAREPAPHLWRQHVLVLDAQHLAQLERGAAHAAQRVGQPLRVVLRHEGRVGAAAREKIYINNVQQMQSSTQLGG